MALRVSQTWISALGANTGKLRVSQDFVSVLGANTGKLRVTQTWVSVLTTHFEFDEVITDTLSILDTLGVDHSIQNVSASNALDISDSVEVEGIYHRELVDTLAGDGTETVLLQDFVNLTYEVSLEDTISLTDFVERIFAVYDTLSLVDTVSIAREATAENILELEDTVFVQSVFERPIGQALDISDAVICVIESPNIACNYTPFGDSSSPVSPTPPTLGTATLTLTWPYVTPTTTLVLRNPDFGNQETHNFDRILRRTRGGDLEVFADDNWPKTKVLKLQVSDLTEDQANDFIQFLGDSLGQEIGLLDWENRQWRGLITTPDAEVTDHGSCKRAISFEFEGELV
jgi:hypothetical protein